MLEICSKYLEWEPKVSNYQSFFHLFIKTLAEKNVNVVWRTNVSTASYDLITKTITLPEFAFDDEDVCFMMGAHEVGHVKYTPTDKYHISTLNSKSRTYSQCLNIVEDIRIERLILNDFPGLLPVFNNGYRALLGDDFFSIHRIEEMSIADRLNIYAKCGKNSPFKLTEKEWCVFKYLRRAKTFEDVEKAAEFLKKLVLSNIDWSGDVTQYVNDYDLGESMDDIMDEIREIIVIDNDEDTLGFNGGDINSPRNKIITEEIIEEKKRGIYQTGDRWTNTRSLTFSKNYPVMDSVKNKIRSKS